MSELLRTGRKVGRTIYVQHGLDPADDDPLIGVMDTEALASRVVDAVNGAALHTVQELNEAREQGRAEGRGQGSAAPVAREDTASSDEDVADPCIEDALGTCHAPGHWHEGQRRRSASPTVASDAQRAATEPNPSAPGEGSGVDNTTRVTAVDTQRAAPTRDALAALERVMRSVDFADDQPDYVSAEIDTDIIRAALLGAKDEREHRDLVRDSAALMAKLRGGGADGGGEDEAKTRSELPDPSGQCDVCSAPLYNVCAKLPGGGAACSARCVDLHRLARAAGVSTDSEDVVGEIEAAIRAGREPEVVTGAEAAELPSGSIVCCWDGAPQTAPLVIGGPRTPDVDQSDYAVLYRAPAPTPAPLQPGDEVTGARAVTAPIDTTLRHTTAAVVALRTVNGWSLTGWTAEADPEHHVRVNTWRVVEVGDGGSESDA